jgi:hypothetical protein
MLSISFWCYVYQIDRRQVNISFQGKRISFRSFLLSLALIAVSKVLNSWRSGLKAASRGIPLAAALV